MDTCRVLAGLGGPPIVIGHSFGGLIAQKLFSRGETAAAVAISPTPVKGL
ncbi:alpha/beta hydrolase [Frankia sp. Mgl5]|nr:alpha/beta hydrolase [Frankia sp. Mgl5]